MKETIARMFLVVDILYVSTLLVADHTLEHTIGGDLWIIGLIMLNFVSVSLFVISFLVGVSMAFMLKDRLLFYSYISFGVITTLLCLHYFYQVRLF